MNYIDFVIKNLGQNGCMIFEITNANSKNYRKIYWIIYEYGSVKISVLYNS